MEKPNKKVFRSEVTQGDIKSQAAELIKRKNQAINALQQSEGYALMVILPETEESDMMYTRMFGSLVGLNSLRVVADSLRDLLKDLERQIKTLEENDV